MTITYASIEMVGKLPRDHPSYHCGEKIAKLTLFHFELIFAS